MADDTRPLPPAGDDSPAPGRVSRQPDQHAGGGSATNEGTTTWAGNRSLDSRWWWSPALMLVVGLAVIGYQSGPIRSGDAIVLNWVMVAIGVAVAVAGLFSLKRAYDAHRAEQANPDVTGGPTP